MNETFGHERNFCERCGKRLGKNAWDVHTCSPPENAPPPSPRNWKEEMIEAMWREEMIEAMKQDFETWWHNEGSQSPTHHDAEEHCKNLCEIAWSNGAYKAIADAERQEHEWCRGECLKCGASIERQEPVARDAHKPAAYANRVIGGRKWLSIHASKGASDKWLEYRRKEQAQGEQYEQVALDICQPQRQPLTYEEVEKIFAKKYGDSIVEHLMGVARAIEAAHGIGEKK